jgi:hypothetical protein
MIEFCGMERPAAHCWHPVKTGGVIDLDRLKCCWCGVSAAIKEIGRSYRMPHGTHLDVASMEEFPIISFIELPRVPTAGLAAMDPEVRDEVLRELRGDMAAERTSQPCICVRDDDGQCPPCRRTAFETAKALATLTTENIRKVAEASEKIANANPQTCTRCDLDYLDIVSAKVLEESYREVPVEFVAIVYQGMIAVMEQKGVLAHPLTDKALRAHGPPDHFLAGPS